LHNSVRIWDTNAKLIATTLKGHTQAITSMSYSLDGTRILTSSKDGTVRVWDAVTGDELVVLRGHVGAVNAAIFTLDGLRIISGGEDKTVRIWDSTPLNKRFHQVGPAPRPVP